MDINSARRQVRLALIVGLCCSGGLFGCVPLGTPVVSDRSPGSDAIRQSGVYTVRRGDTLYSIAWRFGLDYRQLAGFNALSTPFTIFPGQRLLLKPSQRQSTVRVDRSASKPPTDLRSKPATAPGANRPVVAGRTQPLPAQGAERWVWPLAQRPSAGYGVGSQGVDYAINARSNVRASYYGDVVYAGNGIAGFERLIILKHAGDLLSAYSFNGKILVSEQDRVAPAAQIAQVMPRPGDRQKLYFEVRRNGKPINPELVIK